MREVITRALARVPARRAELRMELLARLVATERHLGRTTESLRCITEGEQIEKSPLARVAVPDEPRARLARQKAMTLLQALAIPSALRAARRSVAIARRARLRGELILSLGAEGLCALAAGSPEHAVEVFAEALAHTMEHRPSNAARSRAYLIEALGHAGDARGAAAQYRLAIREAEEDARRGPDGKLAWVRTSYASALHALGKHEKVLEVLEHPSVITAIAETPLPGLRARRYLGLARLALARTDRARDEAHTLLESSPGAYDGLEPALRTTAHVNVLFGLLARMTRGQDVPQTRLDSSLRELPRVPAVVRAGEAIVRAHNAEAQRVRLAALLTKLERI